MSETPHDRMVRMGRLLKDARDLHKLSVRGAAGRADISGTYLSQLEAGTIKEPSPHVLYALADVYGISYAELMRLAGYVVPTDGDPQKQPSTASALDIAMHTTTPLTDDEREALAEYLAWFRSRHGRPPERR